MPKKVLLVDDSSTTLMMERAILQQATNYEVVVAQDGLEAVNKAQEQKPDVIVMDVVMPRMNGFDACRKLRENDSTMSIPVILVTTRGEEHCVEAGFSSGCTDYLTKPVNEHELVSILRNYLGD